VENGEIQFIVGKGEIQFIVGNGEIQFLPHIQDLNMKNTVKEKQTFM
jgi:hypothetical protein